jgi:hypothetical protein
MWDHLNSKVIVIKIINLNLHLNYPALNSQAHSLIQIEVGLLLIV